MIELIKKLCTKYRELIVYGICGVITTLADYLFYAVFTRLCSMGETLAQTVSCAIAILVAFLLNRWVVFRDASDSLLRQFISFVSMRLVSTAFQVGAIWLFVEKLSMYDLAVKLVVSVVVVLSNYVFSKLLIFTEKDNKN